MKTRILVLICGAILASPAAAQEVGDAALGGIYVQQVCAECHAVLPGDMDSHPGSRRPAERLTWIRTTPEIESPIVSAIGRGSLP